MLFILMLGYFGIMFLLLTINPFAAIIYIVVSSVIVKAFLPQIKGYIGEKRVHKRLLALGEKYHVFHDVYLPKEDGTTTQLDHIVVSEMGIFVIETKNYTGWIFGNEKQRNWTQMIYKNKQSFYNPVLQNRTHVNAVKRFLQIDHHVHSIIVFSNAATFKFKAPFTTASVIQIAQLKKTILNFQDAVFLNEEVTAFNEQLSNLIATIKENKREIKRQHIKQVKDAQTRPRKKNTPKKDGREILEKNSRERIETGAVEVECESISLAAKEEVVPSHNQSIETSIGGGGPIIEVQLCPKCSKELTKKRGKYGEFYGCTGFPTCRYTEKIKRELIN